ncbi:glycosyl transferase [Pseudomonas alkylphenolica]|uniref:Glycosyl transferase n=1 Tax=Pseudomonas alkylphenolica TaxID=237609 RepID=A0A443ZZ56_9PSED|nr:glycosyltransferase family 4 protein [Pseudomonas alkylphenolica]RWU26454.1 glycosyl transferase [Pseudomonas alkylphenolica]
MSLADGRAPVNIVNIMWSGGAPYVSVHRVHQQVLARAEPGAVISNWLLQGQGPCGSIGTTREWQLSTRLLKGRGVWKLVRPWVQRRFRQALEQANSQVLLLDGIGVSKFVLPLLRRLPDVRAVILFHGATRLNSAEIALLRSFKPAQLTLVAVSCALAEAVGRDLNMPVTVLRSALEPEVFRQQLLTCEQARHRLGLPQDGGPILGAVGRLVESKGFDYLLDAFASARKQQPALRLVILGEGRQRAQLESRIKALGLEAVVSLLGHAEDLHQLYRAFDWVVIPSRAEGLGLVVQEAVLADVPVLCSDLAVFREQLGDAGCYAPVGEVAAWAQAIVDRVTGDGCQVAQAQYRALAPEQAWQRLNQTSIELLRRP